MSKSLLGIEQIQELLPHRYPILLVDRILELGEDYILGEKLVSSNEPVLSGHFPGHPVLPGVFLLEALAQTACIWAIRQRAGPASLQPALLGIDNARFRRPVVPGDVVQLHVHLERQRGTMYRFRGEARVEGELAADAKIMAAFVPWEESN